MSVSVLLGLSMLFISSKSSKWWNHAELIPFSRKVLSFTQFRQNRWALQCNSCGIQRIFFSLRGYLRLSSRISSVCDECDNVTQGGSQTQRDWMRQKPGMWSQDSNNFPPEKSELLLIILLGCQTKKSLHPMCVEEITKHFTFWKNHVSAIFHRRNAFLVLMLHKSTTSSTGTHRTPEFSSSWIRIASSSASRRYATDKCKWVQTQALFWNDLILDIRLHKREGFWFVHPWRMRPIPQYQLQTHFPAGIQCNFFRRLPFNHKLSCLLPRTPDRGARR
jgi:hypothetical protein